MITAKMSLSTVKRCAKMYKEDRDPHWIKAIKTYGFHYRTAVKYYDSWYRPK